MKATRKTTPNNQVAARKRAPVVKKCTQRKTTGPEWAAYRATKKVETAEEGGEGQATESEEVEEPDVEGERTASDASDGDWTASEVESESDDYESSSQSLAEEEAAVNQEKKKDRKAPSRNSGRKQPMDMRRAPQKKKKSRLVVASIGGESDGDTVVNDDELPRPRRRQPSRKAKKKTTAEPTDVIDVDETSKGSPFEKTPVKEWLKRTQSVNPSTAPTVLKPREIMLEASNKTSASPGGKPGEAVMRAARAPRTLERPQKTNKHAALVAPEVRPPKKRLSMVNDEDRENEEIEKKKKTEEIEKKKRRLHGYQCGYHRRFTRGAEGEARKEGNH